MYEIHLVALQCCLYGWKNLHLDRQPGMVWSDRTYLRSCLLALKARCTLCPEVVHSCSFDGHVLFLNGSGYPQEGGTLLWEGHPSSPKIIRDAGMLCVNWGHHPFWQNILHVSLITIFLDKIYSTREGFVAKQNNGVHIAALERISNPSSFAKEQDCRSN